MGQGTDSYFQFGRETNYGTAVAATHRLSGLLTVNFQPRAAATLEDPTLDGTIFLDDVTNIGSYCIWTLEGVVSYEGLNMLWDFIYGGATFGSNGGSTTGSSAPYTHVFRGGSLLNSYTLQGSIGDIPTGKVQRVTGAKATRLRCEVQAGGGDQSAMRYTLSGIGKAVETGVTPTGSVPVIAREIVQFTHLDILTSTDGTADAAADQTFTRFAFEITNEVTAPERAFRLGYATLTEPKRTGKVVETFEFERDRVADTILDDLLANSDLHPIMKFTDGGDNSIQFEMAKARGLLDSFDSPVNGPNELFTRYSMRALKTGSPSRGSLLTVLNSQATINATS